MSVHIDSRLPTPERTLEISISPRRLARGLILLIVVLIGVGGLAHFVTHHVAPHQNHPIAKVMHRFDLGHEPSLPNWYSSLALLAVAGMAGLLARAERGADPRQARSWVQFSALFVALAVDEAILIHELANVPVRGLLGTSGALYFAWIIPGAGFALAVALFFRRFLFALEARTRNLIVASGAIFVSGAIGVEMLEGIIVPTLGVGSLDYTAAEMIEEGLEMCGVVLVLYALTDHLKRRVSGVYWRIR